jgi:hypothetical protein
MSIKLNVLRAEGSLNMGSASIRLKLALLAGIPVLGAVLLGLALAYNATQAIQKARALGSVESVAELSHTMSAVVRELQVERAWLGTWAASPLRPRSTR